MSDIYISSQEYRTRRKIRRTLVTIGRALLLFGMCFLILQPIFNKISISFMAEQDLYDSTVIVVPKNITLSNYFVASKVMSFWKSLFNTIWVSVLISVIQVAMCALVGYGFARFHFPLKNFWFGAVLLVIIVPPQTISTSLFLHFRFFDVIGLFKTFLGTTLNLRASIIPYVLMSFGCMGLKNGLYIFMIRQYFRGFPAELEEAAYVDGCGPLTTFIRIMLPGARPIITSCFLFAFVWQWTDYLYTELFLGRISLLSKQLASLADALQNYLVLTVGEIGVTVAYTQAIISTGIIMATIPLILLYVFVQREFVESLTSTGIKM